MIIAYDSKTFDIVNVNTLKTIKIQMFGSRQNTFGMNIVQLTVNMTNQTIVILTQSVCMVTVLAQLAHFTDHSLNVYLTILSESQRPLLIISEPMCSVHFLPALDTLKLSQCSGHK